MSGPKVVRIVTREEVEAMCRRRIAVFEQAAADLERCAKRHDLWTNELEAAIGSKRRALQDLFDRQRWVEVQKQAIAEADSLRAEIARMKAGVVSKAEAARGARRRIADAARSLMTALEGAGRSVPPELGQVVSRAIGASDAELASMQAIVNAAFSELRTNYLAQVSAEQRELAGRLGRGEKGVTYADWLAANVATPERDARLDRLLAELEVLEGSEPTAQFAARAAAIAEEPSASRRALLADSLMLDVSDHLNSGRRWEAALASMREVRLELEGLPAAAAELRRSLDAAIAAKDITLGEKLVNEARELAANERRRATALARRRAVLKGLAALGYEIRENMASAWAQAGRIIVRKTRMSDYGVELRATTDAEQMQVRLVGAAEPLEPRTVQRDRDMEALWCDDFGRLRETLSKTGTDLQLEHALPVGAQPVKTVVIADVEHDAQSTRSRSLGQRKL